jgi:hypothetical protein
MKKRTIIIIAMLLLSLFLYPTALNLNINKTDDTEILISKSLSSKKISLFSSNLHRNVFNEINGKIINYNLLGVTFLSTQELLKRKKDNFHSISIKFNQNKATVTITYFKAGIEYLFEYEKKNNTWKEIKSEWGRVKLGPSKPYYIYWEIVRHIDPNYMDFKAFNIPKDSLK